MHIGVTQNTDDETAMLAGVAASSSPARRAGQTVILVSSMPECRQMGFEDASSLDGDGPRSIGELAVKLIAGFSLPRCQMLLRKMDTRG